MKTRSLFQLAFVLSAAVVLCNAAGAAPQIVLEEFRIEPTEFRPGESFTIHARAAAHDAALGSFLLRTADDGKKEAVPPNFTLASGGKFYLPQDKSSFLRDNGPLDGDPRLGVFELKISTRDWKPGCYKLAFFASCRPNPGPFVAARRDFNVTVAANSVRIDDLGDQTAAAVEMITEFQAAPLDVRAGEPVTISLHALRSGGSVRVGPPFYVGAAEVLPGLEYEAERKKAFLTRPMPNDALSLELSTAGWPPGVHLLQVNWLDAAGKVRDSRNTAVTIRGPRDQLQVQVEATWFYGPGTHFGHFLRLRDGTVLCDDKRSTDGGRTWQAGTGGFGVGGEELRDGRILGLEYRCLPIPDAEGFYTAPRFLSTDSGRRFTHDQARVHVPEAKAAMGHSLHRGPLFMRSIVERRDGSLIALMAGWFKSDEALCPYGRGRPYSRSYVCESSDGGANWRYLSTIGYEKIGSEGYNEGSMRRLPSGEILAVLRTGNEHDAKCQDNPIMWSVSRDEGRTWSRPARTGVDGAFPGLAVLSDGRVVMSYGRPGAMLVFSADGGRTWTDPYCVDPTPDSGYTDVVEIAPGALLVGFGACGYWDPETKRHETQLRLARVQYRPLHGPKK